MKKKKKGFTLIELIATIGIIAILAAIIIPNVLSYIKLSQQIKVKSDAVVVLKAYYNSISSGGVGSKDHIQNGIVTDPKKATVLGVVYDYTSSESTVSDWLEADKILGSYTTMEQLQEVVNMATNKIPIENGRLKQTEAGQAILNCN